MGPEAGGESKFLSGATNGVVGLEQVRGFSWASCCTLPPRPVVRKARVDGLKLSGAVIAFEKRMEVQVTRLYRCDGFVLSACIGRPARRKVPAENATIIDIIYFS